MTHLLHSMLPYHHHHKATRGAANDMPQITLAGKAALVTGASRGLGAAIARAYAADGADVALCARDTARLESVAADIRALGRQAAIVPADLSDLGAGPGVVARAAAALGRLDVVVNNAGISPVSKPALEMNAEEWTQILAVNVTAPFLIAQAAAQHMIAAGTGGSLIFMSSNSALIAAPRLAAYSSAKAALAQLTRTLAAEWARHRIRVNAIAPGYFATDMTAGLLASPRLSEGIRHATPLGRIGDPEELTGIALYLASDAASFTTGQVIVVDGGLAMV